MSSVLRTASFTDVAISPVISSINLSINSAFQMNSHVPAANKRAAAATRFATPANAYHATYKATWPKSGRSSLER